MFINDTDHLEQHFLVDDKVLKTLCETANLSKQDNIVEVGPGIGTITRLIAPLVSSVLCIEKDDNLKPYLDEICLSFPNVSVVYANVLDTYIPKCDKIITNLPYSIIEPFIKKLLKCEFEELIMIMGSTYVNSVCQKRVTKLSLLTNSFFYADKVCDIAPSSFNPSPHTLSSIIKLKPKKYEEATDDFTLFMFREMFFYNKSKIKNSLMQGWINYMGFYGATITKRESKQFINSLNLDEEILNKTMEVISNVEISNIFHILNEVQQNIDIPLKHEEYTHTFHH